MTTAYPYILAVNAELPAKTLQEFVALAKSKPDAMNYGSTGVGAANHLVAELFNSKAGIKMTHVPYRGTALAVGDLLAGQLTMVFGDPISVLPHIKSGKLRALAVTSLERSPVAPDVPTVAESGYPGFEALAWHGILAPAKTPPAVIKKLNEEIVKAVKEPATRELLSQPGHAGGRQHAGGIRRLHPEGHRHLEGRGGGGEGDGGVAHCRPGERAGPPIARSWRPDARSGDMTRHGVARSQQANAARSARPRSRRRRSCRAPTPRRSAAGCRAAAASSSPRPEASARSRRPSADWPTMPRAALVETLCFLPSDVKKSTSMAMVEIAGSPATSILRRIALTAGSLTQASVNCSRPALPSTSAAAVACCRLTCASRPVATSGRSVRCSSRGLPRTATRSTTASGFCSPPVERAVEQGMDHEARRDRA